MKIATILELSHVDMMARHYLSKEQGETIMEIRLTTRAEIGEEAKIREIDTVTKVLGSRMNSFDKVARFSAAQWAELRHPER